MNPDTINYRLAWFGAGIAATVAAAAVVLVGTALARMVEGGNEDDAMGADE